MAETHPAITVIVPVYNVADYMEDCLRSIAGQSFSDYEVLLIDDGSDDGSGECCDLWAGKDPRFRVIHKDNGGVSSARNRGIEEARGKWLAFADPDDWLDPVYLERLFRAAEEADADYAECDIWRYDDRTGKKIHRSCQGTMGIPWTREEHMIYGSTASYKAISRRTLWMENGIRFPDCAFESPAVYALVLALSEKTVNVPEPLYYYRRFRPASLIETGYAGKDGKPNNTLGLEAMDHLLTEFRRFGLFGNGEDIPERIVIYRLNDILAMQFHRKSEADYRETEQNFRRYLKQRFPENRNETYMMLGGYNLGRILTHIKWLHDPYCRFTFSSIIAVADEKGSPKAVRHRNRYREMMLRREEDRTFWTILKEVRPAYLFLDLIEERFDILEREDGRYVTASDARDGAEKDERFPEGTGENVRRIKRTSRECRELFRKSVRILIERIRKAVPEIRIVAVENYLSETVGSMETQKAYNAVGEIREQNRVLKEEYAMLREICPEAVWIVPEEDPEIAELLFTDEKYEYGAIPSHLNEIANRKIAALTESMLKTEIESGAGI